MNIKKTEEFAKPLYKKYITNSRLRDRHIMFVRKYAIKLAEIEKADKEVVEIAAILHDVGKSIGKENHNEHSYNLSKDFVNNLELSENKKKLILKCILKHSSRFSHEDNETEVKIIQCADALASLFDEDWTKINKKKRIALLERNQKKINLESAKKIAEPQINKIKLEINSKTL